MGEAPKGKNVGNVTFLGKDRQIQVEIPIQNTLIPKAPSEPCFIGSNGYVSIEAAHFAKAHAKQLFEWKTIPDLRKTLSGVTCFPVNQGIAHPGGDSPHLEYEIYLDLAEKVTVKAYISPSLNFLDGSGFRCGISIDDGPVQLVNIHENNTAGTWASWGSNNINITGTAFRLDNAQPGFHTLKFWLADQAIVLQKLVVETQPVEDTYLGPPESASVR